MTTAGACRGGGADGVRHAHAGGAADADGGADRGADTEVGPHRALEVDSVGALLVHGSADDVTTDGVAARAPLLAHFAAVHADLAAVGEHLAVGEPGDSETALEL